GGVFEADRRRFVARDSAAERTALSRLRQLGFGEHPTYTGRRAMTAFDLPTRDLPRAGGALVRDGWHVEAGGPPDRPAGALRFEVRSGVDWFELSGVAEFGGAVATLPELLGALRRRESTVLLGDGSFGVLPEEWARRYGMLAGLGTSVDDHLRFGKNQVGV